MTSLLFKKTIFVINGWELLSYIRRHKDRTGQAQIRAQFAPRYWPSNLIRGVQLIAWVTKPQTRAIEV